MKINNIGVHIKVKDFDQSRKFYQSLGFKQVFAYGPDQEVKEDYRGMIFEHGGAKLEIAEGHVAVKPEVFRESVKSSKISLMINVDKLSGLIKICEDHKLQIAVGPRHYYWGTLELVLKDPDGVVLVFIAPYDEKEAREISADEKWATRP